MPDPDPTIARTRTLAEDLQRAARLEQAVMLQYLYAAFSLRVPLGDGGTPSQAEQVRRWKRTLLGVARQEMKHLGLACNLLHAVNSDAYLLTEPVQENEYFVSDEDKKPVPLTFKLARYSRETIRRFVRFEQPDEPLGGLELPLGVPFDHIGTLYRRIEQRLRGPSAAAHLSLAGNRFQDSANWSTGDIGLQPVLNAQSAQKVIDLIVREGEGDKASSHFQRFQELEEELGDADDEALTWPTVDDPSVQPERRKVTVTPIQDERTRRACECFNQVYAAMLVMLWQHWELAGGNPSRSSRLRAAIGQIMSGIIRPFGEVLVTLPAGPDQPGRTAGPTFELDPPLERPASWAAACDLVASRLGDAARDCGELAAEAARPRLASVGESAGILQASFIELGQA
jgi:rubrerythrin